MGFINDIFGGWFGLPKNFRHFGLKPINGTTDYQSLDSYAKKFIAVYTNPAMLKVIALQCDMFSLGKFYVYDEERQTIEDDPFLKLIKNPNPFQQQQQFLWEFMFWKMIGMSDVYVDSDIVDRLNGNYIYNLDPDKIVWPKYLDDRKDKIITSTGTLRDIGNSEITYVYDDGTKFKFPYRKMIQVADLPMTNNHFKGRSRIDALYKVIANSDAALDSMNINTRYAGKFLVAGTQDPNDVTRLPMSETEKKDVESKIDDGNPVHAVKSMIDIKRFVENAGNQKLDQLYLHAYYVIGSMYNIPKDVLEAYNSGTFENQEKARGAHVSYSLQPVGDILANAFSDKFGYTDSGRSIEIDWEHLPFMQVFAEQRARSKFIQTQSFLNLQKGGVPLEEINAFLDTEFTQEGQDGQANETGSGNDQVDPGDEDQTDGSNNN